LNNNSNFILKFYKRKLMNLKRKKTN